MAEYIRSIKVILTVDTNKQTIIMEADLDSVDEMDDIRDAMKERLSSG